MSSKVKSVLVVTKTGHPASETLGREIAAWLSSRGIACRCVENPHETEVLPVEVEGGLPDFVLVLGGDGTLLSVARKVHGQAAPLLGLNLGRVGFLTGLTPDNWQVGLSRILGEGVRSKERMMLAYEVRRDGEAVLQGWFVNDIVVNRGVMARLIRLSAYAGDEPISSFRSDGVIVSTPTGSTAYGVSAGGPLIDASLDVYCVTPICPFLNDFRPLVLPARVELTVVVDEGAADVFLTVDGQSVHQLHQGDRILVRRARHGLVLVGGERSSYLDKLRAKGFFTER